MNKTSVCKSREFSFTYLLLFLQKANNNDGNISEGKLKKTIEGLAGTLAQAKLDKYFYIGRYTNCGNCLHYLYLRFWNKYTFSYVQFGVEHNDARFTKSAQYFRKY